MGSSSSAASSDGRRVTHSKQQTLASDILVFGDLGMQRFPKQLSASFLLTSERRERCVCCVAAEVGRLADTWLFWTRSALETLVTWACGVELVPANCGCSAC